MSFWHELPGAKTDERLEKWTLKAAALIEARSFLQISAYLQFVHVSLEVKCAQARELELAPFVVPIL